MPLIRVCARREAGGAGGAEPLAEGGGVVVVPGGAGAAVMRLLLSRMEQAGEILAGSLADLGLERLRLLLPGVCPQIILERQS
jgi:hypothetical protein